MITSITWGLRAWPRQDVRGSVQSLCLSEIALILVHFSEFSWNSLQKSWKIWILGCASYPNFSLFLQTISFEFWKVYLDIVQFHLKHQRKMQKCSDMAVWLMWKICLLFTILCSWHTSCCRSRVRESKFLQFSVFLTQTIICEDSKMQWICFKIRVDVSRPKIASLTFCVFASPNRYSNLYFALSVGTS